MGRQSPTGIKHGYKPIKIHLALHKMLSNEADKREVTKQTVINDLLAEHYDMPEYIGRPMPVTRSRVG